VRIERLRFCRGRNRGIGGRAAGGVPRDLASALTRRVSSVPQFCAALSVERLARISADDSDGNAPQVSGPYSCGVPEHSGLRALDLQRVETTEHSLTAGLGRGEGIGCGDF
jgi:hypothetical protein